MNYILCFDYRSDNGPDYIGPFFSEVDAYNYLSGLARVGFESESSVIKLMDPADEQ